MKNSSNGMKIFTCTTCALLVGLMSFAFVFLTVTPDFTPPTAPTEPAREAVWEKTLDDLIAYLDAKGHLDKDSFTNMSDVGTESRIYNGIDIIWWDVENLEEGSEAQKYWQQLSNDGYIMLFDTYVYSPVANGPFAISASTEFTGNTDELYADFSNFPEE